MHSEMDSGSNGDGHDDHDLLLTAAKRSCVAKSCLMVFMRNPGTWWLCQRSRLCSSGQIPTSKLLIVTLFAEYSKVMSS